ncbi:MAG: cyclic nucleotide-binding domain-containing protein [Alphaproteobacteria bacterium]|nr:cyclic nucleotide-binding domain-containing protein [Alphaproteobacteria bacterium]
MPAIDHRWLGSIRLFCDLPAEDRHRLEMQCRWRRCARGEQIFNRDDGDHDVYFIVQGSARIVNFSDGGREVAYESYRQGDFFGELVALTGESSATSAIAVAGLDAVQRIRPAFDAFSHALEPAQRDRLDRLWAQRHGL